MLNIAEACKMKQHFEARFSNVQPDTQKTGMISVPDNLQSGGWAKLVNLARIKPALGLHPTCTIAAPRLLLGDPENVLASRLGRQQQPHHQQIW